MVHYSLNNVHHVLECRFLSYQKWILDIICDIIVFNVSVKVVMECIIIKSILIDYKYWI